MGKGDRLVIGRELIGVSRLVPFLRHRVGCFVGWCFPYVSSILLHMSLSHKSGLALSMGQVYV